MDLLSLGATATLDIGLGLGSSSSGAHTQYELRIGALMQHELEVISFEGREALNTPFTYDVVFASSLPVAALQAAIFGFPACLSIQVADHDPRVIQGIAIAFEAIGAADADMKTSTRRYSTRIVPRLWLLNHNRKYRVFQDKSAIEIALSVLKDAGITPDIRLQKDKYPPIPFTYQRGETDLEFLHHVLAVAGVFYYFHHASSFLVELIPGAAEVSAVVGGLGGIVGGAADLSVGGSVGAGGVGLGASVAGGLGGGVAGAIGGFAGAVTAAASVPGMSTTMVLSDRSRHTHPLEDGSMGELGSEVAAAGVGALGGTLGAVAEVVGDVVSAVTQSHGDAIAFDGDGEASTASERIFSFRVRTEVRPKLVTMQEWSLPEAKLAKASEKSVAVALDLEGGISGAISFTTHSGLAASLTSAVTGKLEVDAIPIATKDLAVVEYQRDAALLARRPTDPFADNALSQLRADRVVARGDSDSRRLAPGYRFRLAQHPIGYVNTAYVVTGVVSTAYAPDHLPPGTPHLFRAVFDCVPASIDPLPPKPPPRPPLGLEAAIVVGPTWNDVHCDAYGRIQIKFRWAEGGDGAAPGATRLPGEEAGTCWVYWLERWAGNGYGTMTVPRVGSEVLVDFLQSEGGRPIAIGQVYSAANAAPFGLPSGATRVGIRSEAILPATGYSELAIEDSEKGQGVNLRAQGRYDITVIGDQTCTIDANSTLTVSGNLNESVNGARNERIYAGASSHIGHDSIVRVGGAHRLEVIGNHQVVARGNEVHTTGGTFDARFGDAATYTYAADAKCVVGHPDRRANQFTFVYGDSKSHITKKLTLESDTSIVLRSGETVLEITPDGIIIGGKTVSIAAASTFTMTSPNAQLALDDNLTATGKTVKVSGAGASLSLNGTAKLVGSSVSLGSGSGASASSAAKPGNSDQPKQVFIRMRIMRNGDVGKNVAYALRLDNGVELTGSTDGDGKLCQEVPASTATATLTFVDTGEVRNIVIGNHEPPDTVLGAQSRLRQLGYYHGKVDGQSGPLTQHALTVFQRKHAISESGELDDATKVALIRAYHG
jgi:type VI secretion system secreted protein VgrG